MVRGDQEAEIVDAGVKGEVRDQTNVLTFRGFDRANTPVVRRVNVANFETRAFTVQTAGSQSGKTSLVRKHREGVRLVDDLGEFAASEEEIDRGGDVLLVDDRAGRTSIA